MDLANVDQSDPYIRRGFCCDLRARRGDNNVDKIVRDRCKLVPSAANSIFFGLSKRELVRYDTGEYLRVHTCCAVVFVGSARIKVSGQLSR